MKIEEEFNVLENITQNYLMDIEQEYTTSELRNIIYNSDIKEFIQLLSSDQEALMKINEYDLSEVNQLIQDYLVNGIENTNILQANNLYDEQRLEILEELYKNLNLEQLQEIKTTYK